MRSEQTNIVILGGGYPALMMATEVSRRGFEARILERRAEERPSVVLQPAALASLDRLAIFDDVRRHGTLLESLRLHAAGASEPAAELSYDDVAEPYPFAMAVEWAPLRDVLIETFRRYQAVFLEPDVELLGLHRQHGRVRGILGREPEGNVTFPADVIIVATGDRELLDRVEMTGPRPRAYGEQHVTLIGPRPARWGSHLDAWLGPGLAVSAYPVGADRLAVEATGDSAALGAPASVGADELRSRLLAVAPSLEETLKSLDEPPVLHVEPAQRGTADAWTGDGRVAIGPAAHCQSRAGWTADGQVAVDAAAIAHVLSKATYTGDYSRLALDTFATGRRPTLAVAAALADDLHKVSTARSGLFARSRGALLERLGQSPSARRRLIRLIAGLDEPGFGIGDRLRLGGFLGMKPEPEQE